ncbi:ATP-binding cassette domain-containing protein [uncultured Sulfitobacter sp.]|uniref:ATP-binding cassette domain-containing protein n=1 Tax=Sulfitobacter sp. SH22 TaxID=3421172 RepID=UPI001B72CEFD|nr:ATP-binding cassette domain-containing protein [uncultured Sulfitobacter sp.]MBQ0803325.1 ATP-binding cassette domain-containing protein [Sulfitobacter sp.]
MTQKPTFTLTITNGNQGRLRAANAPLPKAENVNRLEDRLMARASLAATYAGLLGVETTARDVFETIAANTVEGAQADQEADAIAKGMQNVGLLTQVSRVDGVSKDLWPALAYMTSGQVLLVMGQSRGDLILYDTTCTDNRAMVPITDFKPFFAGLVVRAEASLKTVAKTHKTDSIKEHWFWGQFPRFRRQLIEVAMGSFVANLLAVAVALFSLQVYDRVIPHQSEATLWVLAAGAGLALLMESFLKMARARLMDGAGRQIELSVQDILMRRLLGMRSDHGGQAPNQLFSAMREFGSVREFFTASTIGTIADIPFIFVFLFLVASIAGNVVWVLVLGGILMLIPGFFLQKKAIQLTQETQGASAKSSRLLHEAIFELDTVKTQRAEDRIMRLWTELNTLASVKSSEQRKLSSFLTFWSQGIQQATYVAAVIVGTYLVFAGQFTVGSIIAVGILTGRTLGPLTQLSGTMARWGNVKGALDGLDAIVAAPQDAAEDRTYLRREKLKGQYELRDVIFRYEDDGAPTLEIKAMMIQPGQHVAVLGANGSGKSSLLKLLSGLYAPTEGRVLIDGTEMTQIEPRDLRRLIGYLGQDVRLFSGSLRDNLNLTMLERDDDRLLAALDFAGLGPFVKNHHKGLDLEIKDAGAGLSIGQRQSIGWARLWLQDPAICLLDEPTAALDQKLEATLVSRLHTWMEGRTAIIATHRAPILALTTRTLVLQDGRMTVDGPKDKVLAHLAGKTGTLA